MAVGRVALPLGGVGLAMMVMVMMVGWQAVLVEGTRYCMYHPEAPECVSYLRDRPDYRWKNPVATDPLHENTCEDLLVNTSNEEEGLHGTKDDEVQMHEEPAVVHTEGMLWQHTLALFMNAKLMQTLLVVLVGVLAYLYVGRRASKSMAREIEAAKSLEAVEALVERCGSQACVDVNRQHLEMKLEDKQRECMDDISTEAAELVIKLEAANRKREFFERWERNGCKTLSVAELESLSAEATDIGSPLAPVIRQWLEFKKEFDAQLSTARLTYGDDSDLTSSLSNSGRLRLLAARKQNLFEHDTICIDGEVDEEEKGKGKEEEEDAKAENDCETSKSSSEQELVSIRPSGCAEGTIVQDEGERSRAKRRSAPPFEVINDYESSTPVRGVERELRIQTVSDARFRSQELMHSMAHLELKLRKIQQAEEQRIEDQERRERENEEKREQARKELEEQKKSNKIRQEELEEQRKRTSTTPSSPASGRALAEADEQRAWSSLKTKLFIHAMLYGTIALYYLWNSIIDSWRTSLDFSAICTPRMLLVPGRVCLPDVAAYMPLHVILPSLVFLLALAIRWGGTFLQLGAFSMLPLILMSIWSKLPSSTDMLGLAAIIFVQLLFYFIKRTFLSSSSSSSEGEGEGKRTWRRRAGRTMEVAEVLLFIINVGLALAVFSRRHDGMHDSLSECFATPSDFGSCYAYF